jgi:hypothetical protein
MNNHEISLPLASMLFHSPEIRQGIHSLANSKSRLKQPKILIFSPLKRTFAMRQGIHSLSDCRTLPKPARGFIPWLIAKVG